MAKLTPTDLSARPDLANAVHKLRESRGWVSNLMLTLTHSPGALQHYQRLGHFARYETDLTEFQREIAVVVTVRNVEYGWVHHGGLLRQCGATDAEMAAIKEGRVPDSFGPAEQALCAFILEFSAMAGVKQATLDRLQQHFQPAQIVDAAMISAYYLAAGSLILGFDVELEDAASLQIELEWQKARLSA